MRLSLKKQKRDYKPHHWWDPFIVIGPGNSGTSTVARILHTELGVHMGDRFRYKADLEQCYYEDLDFKRWDDWFLAGSVPISEWVVQIKDLIKKRRSSGSFWGIKHPKASHILGLYLTLVDDPKLIYCKRPEEDIIQSTIKNYNWSPEQAEREIRRRVECIDRSITGHNVLLLDFSSYRTDEEITSQIVGAFPYVGQSTTIK